MKVLRKISAIITAALTVASMGVIMSTSATDTTDSTPLANPNVIDTSWISGARTDSHPNNFNDYCRRKFNSTSVYVKNASMQYSAKVSVFGKTDKYSMVDYSVSNNLITTTNLTLPANCERQIRQYVNELGYSYVCIHFTTVGSYAASGVWSPDSYGTYQTLN